MLFPVKNGLFNWKMIPFHLSIRQREEGDRIQIKGMTSPKKVSRVFIDEKVSAQERIEWPLLVTRKTK